MERIRIENNLNDILFYLEILGYKWLSGNKPINPTTTLSNDKAIYIEDKTFTVDLTHTDSISFDEFKQKYPITKSHLRSGMVLEYRNNEKRLVTDIFGDLVWVGLNQYRPDPRHYTENLLNRVDNNNDIVKIYRSYPNSFDSIIHTGNLIWERKEFVELTMDEIAEKFGIPVSQLKIKK